MAPLIAAMLDVANDFAFVAAGGGRSSFPFDPTLLGKMSDTLSLGRFSRITTPFTTEVDFADELMPLDSSTFWASFFKLILFDIVAKQETEFS